MSSFCIVLMQRIFSSASISTNKDTSYCNEYVFSEGGNLPIRLRFWGVEISTSVNRNCMTHKTSEKGEY